MSAATLQGPNEQLPLDNTMGAMYIGTLFSAVLYGVTLLQTFMYFSYYPNDSRIWKSLVAFTVVLDTMHLAFVAHTSYHYGITQFYDKGQLNIMVWSVLAEAVPTGVTASVVQFFYVYRMWRLGKSSKQWTYPVIGLITILILATASCGTAWVILSLQRETFQDLLQISGLTISINALSATTDVLITVSLCTILHRARSNVRSSDKMVTRLIVFMVHTGMITTVCAIAALVSLVASPNTLIYATFYFCIGRLYVNSLLASLNARAVLRGNGLPGSGGGSEHVMVNLTPGIMSPVNTVQQRHHTTSQPFNTINIRVEQSAVRDANLKLNHEDSSAEMDGKNDHFERFDISR